MAISDKIESPKRDPVKLHADAFLGVGHNRKARELGFVGQMDDVLAARRPS